jgi:hypothetical protein
MLWHNTLNYRLCIGQQIAKGFTVDPDTMQWWMQQDAKVREHVFSGSIRIESFQAHFKVWLTRIVAMYGKYNIWASAPKLDFGCLHTLLADKGLEYPLFHRSERCLRTYKQTVWDINPKFKLPEFVFDAHDAVQDCKKQIVDAQACYKILHDKQQATGTSEIVHEYIRPESRVGSNFIAKDGDRPQNLFITGRAQRVRSGVRGWRSGRNS